MRAYGGVGVILLAYAFIWGYARMLYLLVPRDRRAERVRIVDLAKRRYPADLGEAGAQIVWQFGWWHRRSWQSATIAFVVGGTLLFAAL